MALTAGSRQLGGTRVTRRAWGLPRTWSTTVPSEQRTIQRTNPLVMRFMDVLVEDGEVQPSVDPIDTVVREQ